MSVQSIYNPYPPIFSLDDILQQIPESATEELPGTEETYQSYKEELNFELKTTDRVWLEFQAGQCDQYGKAAKSMLYRIVKSSVGHPENSISAANAITILKTMKVSFSCLNLQGVQIPGADLSGAILDRADLSSSNLENANLINASLNETVIDRAILKGIRLGQHSPFKHIRQIKSILLSPDGTKLCLQDSEKSSKNAIWDIAGKNQICTFSKNIDLLSAKASVTSDQKLLFFEDKLLKWKILVATTRAKTLFKTKFSRHSIFAISPCERFLLTSSFSKLLGKNDAIDANDSTELILHKLENDKNNLKLREIKKIHLSGRLVDQIYFSPKGSLFVTVENRNRKITLWNFFSFNEIYHIDELAKVPDEKISIYFSPDEKNLYCSQEEYVYFWSLWDTSNQKWAPKENVKQPIISEDGIISSMSFIPNTLFIIYICNNTIYIRDTEHENKILSTIKASQDDSLVQVECSPDGKQIYSVAGSEIQIWHVSDIIDNSLSSISVPKEIKALYFSDTNQIILANRRFQVQKYDFYNDNAMSHKPIQPPESYLSIAKGRYYTFPHFIFTSDSKYIIGSYLIKNRLTENPVYHVELISTTNYNKTCEFEVVKGIFAFCDNCEYFAEVNKSVIAIYRILPSKNALGFINIKDFNTSDGCILCLSENFSGKHYLALADSRNIKLYEIKIGLNKIDLLQERELKVETQKRILKIQFAQENQYVVIACTDTLCMWDLKSNFKHYFAIQADAVDISKDSSLLISCYKTPIDNSGKSINTLFLWDLNNKELLDTIRISLAINKVTISLDKKYVAGYGENGSLYIWQIFEDKLRLIRSNAQQLQAYDLNINTIDGLSDDTKDVLISAGAKNSTHQLS